MKRPTLLALCLGIAGLLPFAALSSDVTERDSLAAWEAEPTRVFQADEIDLNDFAWAARLIVVFANSDRDPAFVQQMELLADRPEELAERDVVVVVDTDPAAESELRQKLRPRGFMMVLFGKDGEVKLRKPLPWDIREITRSIDKMPLRQQEMRAGG